MRNILLIIGLVAVMITGVFGGLKLLVNHIYQSKDCARFNIDHIELRTEINIPEVISSQCDCNGNRRTTKFILDLEGHELTEYLSVHEFEPHQNGFLRTGESNDTKWRAEVEPNNGILTVDIVYKVAP